MIDPTDFLLCGMPSEAAVLSASFPNNPIGSGQAKANLASIVPASCRRIVSMGLCGGLAPPYEVPCILVADSVVDYAGFCFQCDKDFNDQVVVCGRDPRDPPWSRGLAVVPWFSSGTLNLADTVEQRADLYKRTGAVAIDDESYSAAVFCASHKLKFNVVRAISDDYRDTLPPAARGAIMSADGGTNFAYLLSSLKSESIGDDFDLAGVAAKFDDSLAALGQCADALSGPT
jgi:hypothetical protein